MRISTVHSYDATIERLTQRQSELAEAQLRISSNKRVLRASDDPVNAGRAERALAASTRAESGLRSVDASRSAMGQAEGALGDATELLQRAREVLVAAGNPSYDDDQRATLAAQIRDLRQQLLAIANSGDGAGGYLFGGQGASAPPFLDAAGGVRYAGMAGVALAAPGLPVAMDGAAAWMSASTGNGVFETRAAVSTGSAWIDGGRVTDPAALTGATYSLQFSVVGGATTYSVLRDGAPTSAMNLAFADGEAIEFDGMAVTITGAPADGDQFELAPSTPTLSVFDALDAAADGLATPMRSRSQRMQASADDLRNLDALLARISGARADAGLALNRIDSQAERLTTARDTGKAERSVAEDLDMVTALSDFQIQQTSFEAALQAYASVQRLSLFDYIR